jgi:hypothetical protein
VRWQMGVENRMPRAIRKVLGRALINKRMRLRQGFDSMSEMMRVAYS